MERPRLEEFEDDGDCRVSDEPEETEPGDTEDPGEPATPGTMLDRIREIARQLAWRALGDWDEADDVAQEVVIAADKLLEKKPHAFDKRSPNPWVFAIAGNKIVDRLRYEDRREQPFLDYETWKKRQAVAEWDEEGQASASELRDAILRALDEMPQPQSETWRLVYLEGLSKKQAAARRGTGLNAHKKNLRQANRVVDAVIARHQKEGA